jgi:hypothetical protein
MPDVSLAELTAAWQKKLNESAPEPEPDPSAGERIAALEAWKKAGISGEGERHAGGAVCLRGVHTAR